MADPHDLIRQAEAAERLAEMVSYQLDRTRLLEQAARLRQAADEARRAKRDRRR